MPTENSCFVSKCTLLFILVIFSSISTLQRNDAISPLKLVIFLSKSAFNKCNLIYFHPYSFIIHPRVFYLARSVCICVCLYKICSIQKCVWWETSFFISSHISPLAQDIILCNSIKLPSITEESSTA